MLYQSLCYKILTLQFYGIISNKNENHILVSKLDKSKMLISKF